MLHAENRESKGHKGSAMRSVSTQMNANSARD